jgi:hypothetical protein
MSSAVARGVALRAGQMHLIAETREIQVDQEVEVVVTWEEAGNRAGVPAAGVFLAV